MHSEAKFCSNSRFLTNLVCDFRNMPNIFSVDQFLEVKMKKKWSLFNIIVLGTREANNCVRLSTVPEQNSLAHTHL